MNPIDLTLEPEVLTVSTQGNNEQSMKEWHLQQPFECETAEKAGCVRKGMIFANVQLDRGAYVPGESIRINAFIDNLRPEDGKVYESQAD